MSKELPFFKFTANEWLTGDINYESFEMQGLFIAVCSTYWSKDCNITFSKLKQRLSNASADQWDSLIKGGYIKVKGDEINIDFLDEQMNDLSEQHRKKVEAGRKGGKASSKQRSSNAKATVKHKDIDIEEEKDEEEDVDINAPDLFQIFWNLYGNKIEEVKCQREWFNIDHAEYTKIIEHVPKFVNASGKFLCKPINYLEGRRWLDEQLPNYSKEESKDDRYTYYTDEKGERRKRLKGVI